jgi:sarcosine oxidase, subunit alpha
MPGGEGHPVAGVYMGLPYTVTRIWTVGQARYGVLLNENGVVVDDGTVARLAENHFWVNATNGGVERTASAFDEWLQCEFVHMKVAVTPVTSRWSNITVAGPRAWALLESSGLSSVLAPSRFKHMNMAAVTFDGVSVRVLRASFSGELGYEINVPVNDARHVLDRIWSKAEEFSAIAYGVEALQIMPIEKGYIHIGTDTDGTTLPGDIGLARGIERKTVNFVGRRSLGLPFARNPDRLQLVGLESADAKTILPVGAHVASRPPPCRSQGHVTSSALSGVLDLPIAMAMLARGAGRMGERITLYHMDRSVEATVVRPPFYDPKGNRLDGV